METIKKAKKRYRKLPECRACMTTSQNLTPLTSNVETSGLTIHEMLQTIYASGVSSPNVSGICGMCLSLLKIAHDFKLQLEHSEKILKQRNDNFFEFSSKGNDSVDIKEVEIQYNEVETSLKAQESSVQESSNVVELIYGNKKYDLSNVVIVENDIDEEEHNYSGFLDNLGDEVSAEFVKDKPERVEKCPEEEISIYINLPEAGPELEASPVEQPKVAFEEIPPAAPPQTSERKKKKRAPASYQQYQCEVCGFICKSRSAQRYHAMKHRGPRYQCKICPGKTFYLGYKLTNHMKTYHKGERPFLCNVCGKGFPFHSSLSYHMKVHNDEKNYCCELCGDKFYLSGNLTRHMLTHTKERPHKCQFCEKRFPVKNQRKLHENMHLNIKPHACKYCGKKFNRLSNLKYHHMTHAGTFKCNLCEKSFMEPKYLTTHLRRSHKVVAEPPASIKIT